LFGIGGEVVKDYFYMFSQGCYSDYCVGGMYKSKQELTKEWFAKYLKTKMIEQVPEAKEFLLSVETTIEALTSYIIPEKLYIYCTQDERIDYNADIQLEKERRSRKEVWLESKGFTQSITDLAIKDGILEKVEYKEIWNDC
jgi:hypothetical protein